MAEALVVHYAIHRAKGLRFTKLHIAPDWQQLIKALNLESQSKELYEAYRHMSSLRKEIVFLILQFLDEEKYKKTIHRLELESNYYFNMRYFEELVTNGKWDEVEEYISGFTKLEDNQYSLKTFFEIRKQKYLEALDKLERGKALEILVKDLKVFECYGEDLFKELTQLLTLDNFRINENISKNGDTKSRRGFMFGEIKKLIEANPLFRDKLQFPLLESSKLKTLINESLNQHHQLSEKSRQGLDSYRSLLLDNFPQALSPATNPLMCGASSSRSLIQPTLGLLPTTHSRWMANPQDRPHRSAFSVYRNANTDHVLKRLRSFDPYDQISNTLLPVSYPVPTHEQNTVSSDDLPNMVVMTLPHAYPINSMDFHPIQQILLLVGTTGGVFFLWNLGSRKVVTEKVFYVWKFAACSKEFQTSLNIDGTVSVNHVAWSPDGNLFGVAYSKSIVHIYSFHGDSDIQNHLEIEAHKGSVSHLAFSYPNKNLSLVTCGDDRTVKVWDAITGANQFSFEGHEAPVFSVCPHHKENTQFIFSTADDGKIKVWLYDNMGPRLDYVAPGNASIRMAYSCDGKRLFSCGTNKEGESFLLEYNDTEGFEKRVYQGLGKRADGVVKFDTSKNRFLVVGDEYTIKIWDMDKENLLTTIPADGGLSASPCVRVNREGVLLAVSTNDHGVRILATNDGVRLLTKAGNCIIAPTHVMKPIIADDSRGRSRTWKVKEITEPSQCLSLRLDDNVTATKISRLIYTNSGTGILALASNAVHKFWKWHISVSNLVGQATTCAPPVLWQPTNGILMTNDIKSDRNPKYVIPCFAISKNDSYAVSSSGAKISLFRLVTFETMATFMAPPPAATFLAFYPLDNNIIAIGMEDSSIQIYSMYNNEVKAKLNGHQKRITGLAFSEALNILVSSGDDLQLCVWSTNGWEKLGNTYLQVPYGKSTTIASETCVQFHMDKIHLLAVHETQIAILDAQKLEYLKQWFPCKATGPITSATYTCDSESIFVSFKNGCVYVLTSSNLRLRCKINPAAYLPSNPSSKEYPLVIAAHPSKTNQFAVGLSNGGVYVVEPSETELGKWGTSTLDENGASAED